MAAVSTPERLQNLNCLPVFGLTLTEVTCNMRTLPGSALLILRGRAIAASGCLMPPDA